MPPTAPISCAKWRRSACRAGCSARSEEARYAGEGVLYAIPGAKGLVGDLGGGSLELVEVDGKEHRDRAVAAARRASGRGDAGRAQGGARRSAPRFAKCELEGKGRPFYLVGGSWRALARVDMALTDYPLPIIHNYRMAPERARELVKVTAEGGRNLDSGRAVGAACHRARAAMLLELLVEEIGPSELVVSAAGIREGLLYSR